ncbi:hypothetical protein LTR72_004992 [Exophiala xenobiotica]|nr:hypothetical protein LTR72_004992 [Exophiala xenobiotica]KAK5286676.1 hypothetical protein LTR14_009743 [Exophiala xenobiotica]KAK5499901.1 hypothetical protein LTR55_000724 [Exophiala xenobiotica]
MSHNFNTTNSTRPMGPLVDVEASAGTSWRNFYIDCAALFVTTMLVTGLVILYTYVWRNRCRGNDCEFCREYHGLDLSEEEEDKDVGFVHDEKYTLGKKD